MGALACSLIALLLGGGGSAQGPKYMKTVIQDDAQLLHRSPASVRQSMHRIKALGATTVRITASWSSLAPSPRARKVPGGDFDPTDSRSYPKDSFDSLDEAIRDARDEDLDVMIDLAFWAPRWAVGKKSSNPVRERAFVDPAKFADFATAVARRYGGSFHVGSSKLPAVRTFTTWNEPNHPSFLSPQWRRTADGGWRPESPHVYRAMHDAAYDAIKAVSTDDEVLLGGLASTGSTTPGTGGVPPLPFVRALACVDDAGQPLQVPECANYTPIKADGFAFHPYSRYTTPGTSSINAGDAPIADVDRLDTLLTQLTASGRIAGKLPIYDTEYGYETSEDDPFAPFDRDQQAAFQGWSTYLAYKQPDTVMFAQFLLQDIDPAESGKKRGTRSYYRDFQTGLYDADGDPKPSLQAFKLPFWAQTVELGQTKAVLLFGGVRPGDGERTVKVERRAGGTDSWGVIQTVGESCRADEPGTFSTDEAGWFTRYAPAYGAAAYRLVWKRDDGTWEYGAPVEVGADPGLPPDQ